MNHFRWQVDVMKGQKTLRAVLKWLFSSEEAPNRELADQSDISGAGSSKVWPTASKLPPGVRIYAIGDIHGRADLLRNLLSKVDADRKTAAAERTIVVFLGDYIDRGPASRDVIDLLLEYRARAETIFLKGNHEEILLEFLGNSSVLDTWRSCGGFETLVSYGLKPSFSVSHGEERKLFREFSEALPDRHLQFLKSLQLYFQFADFLFVHAGVRPRVKLMDQEERDLLWIRDEFLDYPKPFDFFVVHGHTPVYAPDVRSNRLNIDTGAYVTGQLTCAAIEGATVRLLST
jgi:serine/threonine protein phosphatase 1